MSKTMNVDVAALCSRGRRYRKEIESAQSANVAFVNEHDFRRFKANLNSLIAYIDFAQSQSLMDSPEYHGGRELDLGDREELQPRENEAINDLCRLYEVFDVELVNCQSSRMSSKFVSHDEKRLRDIVARAHAFLDQYISQILPLDLPETSPSKASVPAGRTGVSPG